MTEVCTDSRLARMMFRFLSFRPLRFCHSERSEESWYYTQGRLREKSLSFCKARLATNLKARSHIAFAKRLEIDVFRFLEALEKDFPQTMMASGLLDLLGGR